MAGGVQGKIESSFARGECLKYGIFNNRAILQITAFDTIVFAKRHKIGNE